MEAPYCLSVPATERAYCTFLGGYAETPELESRAREAGITSFYLDTSIGQVAAQKLYTACGYTDVGHIVQSGVECVLYEKNVA